MSSVALLCLLWVTLAAAVEPVSQPDVLYKAMFGDPETVDAGSLLGAPGRYVGRAVRARGSLVRSSEGGLELVAGDRRARVRLEPEAAAMVAQRASALEGRAVEVIGFFYRQSLDRPQSAYALRAWSVMAVAASGGSTRGETSAALALSLEQLVYSGGRYDGRLVRVRGSYRGANLHNDLPEATRAGPHDWVIKDGYFAVWVTGRKPRGEGWDLTRRSRSETDTPLEVVGVPEFRDGVVYVAAREVNVATASTPMAPSRGLGFADPVRDPSQAPRVTFAYPVEGDTLDAQGHMIIQFSNAMDPTRLETGVRVRYERSGHPEGTPRVRCDYRDRYRALVITPQTPPPRGVDVVVDLRDVVIDVDGHALAPRVGQRRDGPAPTDDTVDEVRFRSRP
jgi:hypothetical protein